MSDNLRDTIARALAVADADTIARALALADAGTNGDLMARAWDAGPGDWADNVGRGDLS